MAFFNKRTSPADKFTTAEVAFLISFADSGGVTTWHSESSLTTITGSGANWTLSRTPAVNSLQLVLNDAYLIPGSDYTLSGANITLINGNTVPAGAVLYALYQ